MKKSVYEALRHGLENLVKMLPNTICTPFPLIEQILDHLPKEVWSNPNFKWLDPACGRGAFLLAIKARLVAAGIPEKHVVENMLYGADIDSENVNITRAFLAQPLDRSVKTKYSVSHIVECDSLKKDWGMKFDVVVGNPPYQAPGKENKAKLWPQFVDMAFDKLVATNGYVSLIVPKLWLTNGQWETHFSSRQIIELNIDQCRKHFADVHSSFSYFIVQNHPPAHSFIVTNDVSSTTLNTAPLSGMDLMYTGIVKNLVSRHDYFPMITSSGYNTSGFSSGKKTLSLVKTDQHTHFVIHKISHVKGETTGFWSSELDYTTYGIPRVVVGLWLSDWKRDRMMVGTELLTCEQFRHFPADTIEQTEVLKTVLSSKLYTYLLYNLVDGNSSKSKAAGSITNRAVSFFPRVDLSRSWTDEELYSHFNITKDEISLIEETIK